VELTHNERLPHAVLKVLRKQSLLDSSPCYQARIAAYEFRSEKVGDGRPVRCIGFLVASAFFAEDIGLQIYAVLALGKLSYEWTKDYLELIFRYAPSPHARAVALEAIVSGLQADASRLVLEALNDHETAVRSSAVKVCFFDRIAPEFRPIAGPRLFQLLGDSSKFIRTHAAYTLKKYGYLADEWFEYMGPATYLGPG
jgi:hypothetical protein